MERNRLSNFGNMSFKENLCEIVLNPSTGLAEEVVSSFFSIYSSGGHLVHQSRKI